MTHQTRRPVRFGLSVALIVVIFASGFTLGALRPALPAQAAPAAQAAATDTQTEQLFKPFWEAWDLLHENYVDPLDDSALLEGALSGMMSSIGDRHTNYFDPGMAKSVNDEMTGQFSGIGATIKKDEKTGVLTIVSTIPGAPARAAGLLPGDVIVKVDGVDVTMLPESKVISKVRGVSGTQVQLGIERSGKPMDIVIERAVIKLPTVVTATYPGDIGYIKLSEFNAKASSEFSKGLHTLKASTLKGLVIDFRGNPGGYLTTAVDVASQFLKTGLVLQERGKDGQNDDFKVRGRPYAPDVPLIVLVDGGSASASELVAGALQDYGRARLLGEQTYGKGSVQIIQPLSNGGAAHITIARWYTPFGRTIQDVGLTPDFKVTWDENTLPDRDLQLEQALLILRGEL